MTLRHTRLFHTFAVAFASVALLTACDCANAQSGFSGTLENYFEGSSLHGSGVPLRIVYVTAQDRLSPDTRIVGGGLRQFGYVKLGENYIEQGTPHGIFRIGRFRSAFGHSDWSELYHTGLPNIPLIRAIGIDYYGSIPLQLTRLDTGIDYQTTVDNMQYQVGVIDKSSGDYQLTPRQWNTAVGRAQVYTGDWIVGLNGLANYGERMGQTSVTMYDLDWRWTAPAIQWRGEALASHTGGTTIKGYYQELSYHTLALPKTTFLLRTEAVHIAWVHDQTALLDTIGIKQTLSPQFVAEVSQSWGNGSKLASAARGAYFQLITFTDF